MADKNVSSSSDLAAAMSGINLPVSVRDASFKPTEYDANRLITNLALLQASYSSIENSPNELLPIVDWRKDASLVSVTLAGGERRAFRKLASYVDNNTGAKIFAYQEVGASKITDVNTIDPTTLKPFKSSPIRLIFPGMGDMTITDAEKASALDIATGKRSPQIDSIRGYLQNHLFDDLRKSGVSTPFVFEIFGHSLGAGNALLAKHLLSDNAAAKTTGTTLFESYGAGHEASHILREAKQNSSTLNDPDFVKNLFRDVSSVDIYPYTSIRQLHLGNDSANKIVGDKYFLINHAQMFERAPTILADSPFASTYGETKVLPSKAIRSAYELISQFLLDQFDALHNPAPSIKILIDKSWEGKLGEVILRYSPGNNAPTVEQLLSPEKFNTKTPVQGIVSDEANKWLRSR